MRHEYIMVFKPTLRPEAEGELRETITQAIKKMVEVEFAYQLPYKTCINCDHFIEKTEMCKQWNAKPPARVIAFGCDKYKDEDLIPF